MEMELPKGWNEITIAQYIKYYTLSQSKFDDLIDFNVELLAILSGESTEDILNIPVEDIVKYVKQLEFLKELPPTQLPYKFRLNGNVYKSTLLMGDMTAGQFMNFSDTLKGIKPEDYAYEMHKLLGCMCLKRERGIFFKDGKLSFVRYKYGSYVATANEFHDHMTMDLAYPFFVFFCKSMEKSLPAIQDYLIKKLKKMKSKPKYLARVKASLRLGLGLQ